MAIDIQQLTADIKTAATDILRADVTTFKGFSERQVKAIAQQSALVEIGIQTGQITDETKDFFLDGLEDMALNFVRTLRGLLMVTIEKVWNAIVGAIWKAIQASIPGITLPVPTLA